MGIVNEWDMVVTPPPPETEAVSVDPATTALLVLDIQQQNCSIERRPRCVDTVPAIQALLTRARAAGMAVVYSLTRSASREDILPEVAPLPDEPSVASSVDKFFGTELDRILRDRGIRTVILVGTSADGAVLNTATGAAEREYAVVVPVDGISATEPFSEQYTCWYLLNSPGTRRATTLTRTEDIAF